MTRQELAGHGRGKNPMVFNKEDFHLKVVPGNRAFRLLAGFPNGIHAARRQAAIKKR